MEELVRKKDVETLLVFSDLVEHKTCEEVAKALRTLPIIEPKHGMWERIPYSFVGGFRCSCCGTKTLEKYWNFCPNCGADMRGADDE